jgi:hypothetical protein
MKGRRGGLGRKLGCYLLHRAADKTEGEAGWPETAQEKKRKEEKKLFSIFYFLVLNILLLFANIC